MIGGILILSTVILIILLLFVVVLLLAWVILTYNNFIRKKAFVNEAFSGMDVYLKKRCDLIPNLVSCVKGYMSHEKTTLSEIIRLRNLVMESHDVAEKIESQAKLSDVLTRFFALSENYPDLKANQQFISLQGSLSSIEEDLSQSRKYYNGAVKQFNVIIATFPNVLLARLFHFTEYPYYEIAETDRNPVKVDF